MHNIAKRILNYRLLKPWKSTSTKQITGEPAENHAQEVFATFTDGRGNSFELQKGLRDKVRPGWQAMLEPQSGLQLPSETDIQERIRAARTSVEELLQLLKIFSFNIENKRVLEMGCYDGVRTYALAQKEPSEVVGSDIASYYILQRIDGEVSEVTVQEQNRYLESLRAAIKEVICLDKGDRHSVSFIEDNICSSSLPCNRFDLVCGWELLEHVQEPRVIFQEIYRLLAPGGLAFHEYNPFFCLSGGHSLCTLDFPWGHARLDENNFSRYLREVRPNELNIALRFYRYNLNRMTLSDLQRYSAEAGFETLALIPWPDKAHLKLVNEEILTQCKKIFPSLTLLDLVTPSVWLVQRKS